MKLSYMGIPHKEHSVVYSMYLYYISFSAQCMWDNQDMWWRIICLRAEVFTVKIMKIIAFWNDDR
jgi:hypothetical protein